MNRLLLLRHARAGWAQPGMTDFDRALDEQGFREAGKMGAAMRASGFAPHHAICSTARRARETWETVGHESGFTGCVTMSERLYSADAAGYLDVIRAVPDDGTLILIGHNPMTEDVALGLVDGQSAANRLGQGFPTAGMAVIDIDAPWSAIEPGIGRLVGFLVPAEL